jgi:FAD/FMN-containing dehydrogenase
MGDPHAIHKVTSATTSWNDLHARLHGQLVLPDDARYEEARHVYCGMFDKRPSAVAQCADAGDVAAAVNFARERGLLLAVRGGGHSAAGHSTCDGGLVIDLAPMKAISVDPVARTARAEGGVRWAELDAATQRYGLAVTGGTNSDTGIAGLTLGGGIGWLMRTHGYACDNLLAAEVVLAGGTRVRASEQENADLFWGLRGGGGNFGVVTAFEYRLHPVGPEVLTGPLLYPLDQARDVIAFQRDFMRDAPDAVTVFNVFMGVPPMEPYPEALHGQNLLFVAPLFVGPIEEGERALAPLRAVGKPLADTVAPVPYVALQQAFDALLPRGIHIWDRTDFLADLDLGAVDVMVEATKRAPAPATHMILVARQGGVITHLADDATAFAHRDAAYLSWVTGAWPEEQPDEPGIAWTRQTSDALRPFTTGATYVNALQDEGEARIRAAYPPQTYARLVALKRTYDPGNLFRLNQNIVP